MEERKMSEKNTEYFEKQIKGLLIIMEDAADAMVARSYIKEKLNMILNNGINFHPSIKDQLEKKEEPKANPWVDRRIQTTENEVKR